MDQHRLPPARPRLLAALSGDARFVLVHGPRLSGKTTLLRQWMARSEPGSESESGSGVRLGLVGPDRGISEQDYWALVVRQLEAARGRGPGSPHAHARAGSQHARAGSGHARVNGSAVDGRGGWFDQLKELVRTWGADLTLVLDDVHLIDNSRGALRELVMLSWTAGFRVIVTTTTTGGWYGPAGVPADTVIIRPADLVLSDAEVGEAAAAAGVDTSDRSVPAALADCTGRVAGFVAAGVRALQAGEHGPASAPAAEVVRPAVDQLVGELVGELVEAESLRPHQLEQLLRLAAVDPLTGPAVAVVAGEAGGVGASHAREHCLPELERRGLVIRDQGAHEASWRFPEPVRRALLARAETDAPGSVRSTRVTIARYWLHSGRPHAAFVHAIDAGDWELVLTILRGHWRTLYTSDFLHLARDLARIPDSVLQAEPLFAALLRRHDDRGTGAGQVPGPAAGLEPGAGAGLTPGAAAGLTPGLAAGLTPGAGDRDQPTGVPEHADRLLRVGRTLILTGRFDEAIHVLRRVHRMGGDAVLERRAAGDLALAHAVLGSLADAETWEFELRRHASGNAAPSWTGDAVPDRTGDAVPDWTGGVAGALGSALAHLDRLELDDALDLAAGLGAPADDEELWGFALYVYGQLALTAGAAADGLRYVESHLRRFTGGDGGDAVAGPLLRAVRADLLLSLGRAEAAEELVGGTAHPFTAAARARIRVHVGDHAGALRIVEHHHGQTSCTARDSLELSLLGAAGSLAVGAGDAALAHLERAVAKSRLSGLVRPFTTLPRETLERLAALGPALPVRPDEVRTTFPPAAEGPIDVALTAREDAILRSLATGDTIGVIAATHFVSVNTVKSQLRSLYRKLGVRSRDEAVDLARRRGLL